VLLCFFKKAIVTCGAVLQSLTGAEAACGFFTAATGTHGDEGAGAEDGGGAEPAEHLE
jgi:hypothetical protein